MYEFLQVVGTMLGVGLPAWGGTVWILRRMKFPPQELWYELTSSPVLNLHPEGIYVKIGGQRLKEPYAATLHVWSTGTDDIPSTAFDGSVPITIRLDRPMLGDITAGGMKDGSRVVEELLDDRHGLSLHSGIIRKNYRATWSFVTDGIAIVDADHSLFGATLQSAAKAERKSDRTMSRVRVIIGLLLVIPALGLITLMVLGIFGDDAGRDIARDWIAVAFGSFAAGLGIVIATASVPSRWSRAQKKRGASRFDKYDGDPFRPRQLYHSS